MAIAGGDPAARVVRKRRTCFLWQGQYFELDRFDSPRAGLVLLEAELDDASAAVSLPAFLAIDREVTADAAYANASIARTIE